MIKRWLREFTEFFFTKGNAIYLAIAVVVGTQFQLVVDTLTKDLIMPLINPLIPNGDWHDLVVPYYGGEILIGKILDVLVNSLVTGWALFFIFKSIKRFSVALEGRGGLDEEI